MKVTTRIEELQLRHTFTISRSSQDVVPVVICEVEHEGVRGIGEASPSEYYDETVQTVIDSIAKLEPLLSAADPWRYHDVLSEASEILGAHRSALCALDTALHDWLARRLGQPLHRILGLDARKAPLSSFTIGISSTEHMVEKAREATGYPILKIKLGTERDLEIIEALRAVSDAVFRVDANCAWSVPETIEKSSELARLGVEFIEQPLPPDQLDAMEELFHSSALPLFADENSIVPGDIPKLPGRFHGINIKLVKCGGILPALRMVNLARTLGLRIMYGCMIESSVLINAAAQIAALADHLDLDGNVLISNDPFTGLRNEAGRLVLPALSVEPA